MKIFLNVLFALLPSVIKKLLLLAMGHKICWTSYIGISYINIFGVINLGRYSRIGSFNFLNTHEITLDAGSKIGAFNWIAGKSLGEGLRMGICSSIRRFHYLDTTGGITIGANTIIAGRGTVIFTHGLSPKCLDVVRKVVIGDWVYIGARVNILPGTSIANGIFVGMGSTVVGNLDSEYSVYTSQKAQKVSQSDSNDIYYQREVIIHNHLKGKEL
ncbi:hypothetical protein N9062_04335 [Akkermansiaceae bacterium]|nr:hypothetical protein [Akkermansiaceae bacterium]